MLRILSSVVLATAVLGAVGCQWKPAPRTDWAAVVATALAVESLAAPARPPQPAPGDVCSNCNGRGEVGDGRVMIRCPVCDGTGHARCAADGAGCPVRWSPSEAALTEALAEATSSKPLTCCPREVVAAPIAQRGQAQAPAGRTTYRPPRRVWFPRLRTRLQRFRGR